MQETVKVEKEKSLEKERGLYLDLRNFGMDSDVTNEWLNLYHLKDFPKPKFHKLKPLLHYEETLRQRRVIPESLLDYAVQNSNQDKVKAYNDLVDELNSALERIVREKDVKAAREIATRAMNLVGARLIPS